MEALQRGQYREAFDTFQGLTLARPEDARVWYLAAVSRGLATGEWGGQTQEMAHPRSRAREVGNAREALDRFSPRSADATDRGGLDQSLPFSGSMRPSRVRLRT